MTMMLRSTLKRTSHTCLSYLTYFQHRHHNPLATLMSHQASIATYSSSAALSLFQYNNLSRQHQQQRHERHPSRQRPQLHRGRRSVAWSFSSTPSTADDADDFQPLPPPPTHGTPVFPDVDLTTAAPENSISKSRNTDPDAVFVVTGANRGIGLQFVKTLLATTRGSVMACCRNPAQATALQELQQSLDQPARLCLIELDLADQESITACGAEITRYLNKERKVDMLINVAGILGDGKLSPGPERSLRAIQRDWMQQSMTVNCIGPVMLIQELAPLMTIKARKKTNPEDKKRVAVIANVSARVGSIADNEMGGWYSYRISKAGLNQATRTIAHELKRKRVWCVALHPGTTETDLSQPFQSNVKPGKLFPVSFTVKQLLQVIDSLSEQHTGGFYDWAGKSISF